MGNLNHQKRARQDLARGGGADDPERGANGTGYGSFPASKAQWAEMVELSLEADVVVPPPPQSRDSAKRWLAKTRVRLAMDRAHR